MKKAVIACNVFYTEIKALIENKDIDLELLPQGLHNLVDSEKMKAVIQQKIDELESKKGYDYIILAYGYCSGGVEGLAARRARLVVGLVHDCIPLLCGRDGTKGIDDGATYYLSRGWIDCGGDSYKEHLFLTGRIQRWLEKFERYRQENSEALVLWPEKDQYRKTRRDYSPETAEIITFELLKNYRSLTLIDNGNLEPIHLEYAREMHAFLDELLTKNRGAGLELQIKPGDSGLLKRLLFFDELNPEERQKMFLFAEAGEPLQLKRRLLRA